jgi:RNase H-fold protein (predicted Holliday junction resolvase)
MENRIIGIDFGKNIGVAIAIERLAMPLLETQSLQELANIIKQKQINFLVIGWPLSLNGSEGKQCLATRQQLSKLLSITGNIRHVFQDERFSSKFTLAKNASCQRIHAQSAAWILQVFLDSAKHILSP